MKVCGMIPARLESERFPNKLLAEIDGKKLIDHVIENAQKLNFIDKLVLATDSQKLIDYCRDRIEIFKMSDKVSCGSERMKYVYQRFPDYDYYISIPSDEPFIDSKEINTKFQTVYLNDDQYQQLLNSSYIRTFYSDFYSKNRLVSLNSCKIVSIDKSFSFNGKEYQEELAIYFSRNIVPYSKKGILDIKFYKKHLGIFIFPNDPLKEKDLWSPNKLSSLEGLEQNMFIENAKIGLLKVNYQYYGIDTKEDIISLEKLLGVIK